jgi:signal transduction histidine kinase
MNTRTPSEALARQTEKQLEAELRDSRLLQEISAQLIHEQNVSALYEKIIDGAVAIMRSEFASMQMLYPERGKGGELLLLAFRGFNPQAAKFWQWVRADSESTCGVALRTGQRVIAADVENCDFMAGTEDLATYLQTGIRAVQTTPLFSRDGKLVGMISTHWQRPHQPSERDLRLLDILARQAADLIERRRAEEALREADRRKDEFLGMLSHELRNPLAPICSVVTLLQLQGDVATPELRAQACGILERQVGHLVRLVDDLLDVSRITRGTLGLQPCTVELAAIVHSAVETSRPLIDAASHELELDLPREPVRTVGDPVRLAQLVTNVLNNAARYTPPGGQIRLALRRDGAEAVISVRDNGIGIEPAALPGIFEMFAQAAGTRSRFPGGLGVGLALARRLAEMHGGTLQGASEGPGRGSEFVVRLPVESG